MTYALPPLNALRAFEAAARRGGFAKAADELHVTPAAISHQVKALEDQLGIVLFLRRARGLELTDAGRQLLPELSKGFSHMARGIGSLAAGGLAGPLRIGIVPTFAALWLVPRLNSFLDTYPEIELVIEAQWPTPDVTAGSIDMLLTYSLDDYPGMIATLLMRETVFPVCAPGLLNQAPLRRFSDLKHHRLLHDIDITDEEPSITWRRWLRDAGVSDVDPDRGLKFTNVVLLNQAAIRGQGVALGRSALVAADLAAGNLVRPLKGERPADFAYYLVTTSAATQSPRVQAFHRWLEDQVDLDDMTPTRE